MQGFEETPESRRTHDRRSLSNINMEELSEC